MFGMGVDESPYQNGLRQPVDVEIEMELRLFRTNFIRNSLTNISSPTFKNSMPNMFNKGFHNEGFSFEETS